MTNCHLSEECINGSILRHSFIQKTTILLSKGLKRLKSVRANMPHVKDIPFVKSNSLSCGICFFISITSQELTHSVAFSI